MPALSLADEIPIFAVSCACLHLPVLACALLHSPHSARSPVRNPTLRRFPAL